MAHMIDTTTGKPAIAFAGDTPWHGLGERMEDGMSIEQWQQAAGLAYTVNSAPVEYQNGERHTFAGRNVLYRSDTGAALSVVSDQYKPVQPDEVMDFFRTIVSVGGFEMESAGVLAEGRRIWALAKVNEGAEVTDGDTVKPYLLLATSYDGSMATTAKFTTVRVVCQNTLSMASSLDNANAVKVLHREKFNPDAVRADLGIVTGGFARFMQQARQLSQRKLTKDQADLMTFDLVGATTQKTDPRQSKGYERIMSLFTNQSYGNEIAGQTAWGWVNAVTEMVDWERGRNASSRINSAWFGAGDTLKNRAMEIALTV